MSPIKANRFGKLSKTLAVALGAFVLLAPGVAAQGALVDLSSTTRATGQAGLDASSATQIVDQVAAEVEHAAANAHGALEANVNAQLDATVEAPVKAEEAAGAGVGFASTVKGYMGSFLQKLKGFFTSTAQESRAGAEAEAHVAAESALGTGQDLAGDAQGRLAATQSAAASARYGMEAQAHANAAYVQGEALATGEEVIAQIEGTLGSAQEVAYHAQHAAEFEYSAHVDVKSSTNAASAIQPPKIPQPSPWVSLTSSLQAALTGLVQFGGFGF